MRLAAILVAALAWVHTDVQAQLLSPGPLSEPHAELSGVRRCTACHQLGQRGADTERCLSCHEALGARLRAKLGYHATLANKPCGSCHAEHYGREFALVRLDSAVFDHNDTGYALRSAHRPVACRDCHRPENVRDVAVRSEKENASALRRTYLGLSATCGTCHVSDDPHGRQFGTKDCAACHAQTRWTEAASFDHSATAFGLTGRHRAVDCTACHPAKQGVTQYGGIAHRTCTGCHTDPHRGGQGAACESCHTTTGWRSFGSGFDVTRFDHARTRFALRAAHARIDCRACHRSPARSDQRIRITLASGSGPTRFPSIVVRDCRSCHLPAHPGAEPGRGAGANCASCHDETAWSPASFGLREHAATRFPLDGAHVLIDCARCHTAPAPGGLEFRRRDITCVGCHAGVSPHGRAYEDSRGRTDCARCHVTRSWQPTAAPHDAFPLTGAHASVTCAACHTSERANAPRACEACHAAADPHRGQSAGRTCSACHDTSAFTSVGAFDHSTTRFNLEGAHRQVACVRCHVRDERFPAARVLRYAPLASRCEDCHGR